MKKQLLLFLIAAGSYAHAQLLTNKGAQVTVTNGAIVHVFGAVSNEDNGANNGVIDNSGNFWVRNGTAGFNGDFSNISGANVTLTNGSRLYVARNYHNDATFTANNGSTVFFNGTGQQLFTRGAAANAGDSFYDVIIQNTAGSVNGVQLPAGPLNIMTVRNQLNFDNGATPQAIIVTANDNYVYVNNTATTGIINYGVNYYINGRLRRDLTTANAIFLPVGDVPEVAAGKGYQLAQLNHSNLGDYTDVTASFTPVLTPTVLNSTAECGNDGYDSFLDNGRWVIDGNPAAVTKGSYTMTLYPRNFSAVYSTYDYTQFSGNASATIQKTPNNTTNWALDGTCNMTSNLAAATPFVIRNNIPTGFSDFQIAIDENKPFPVEWLPLTATPNVQTIDLKFVTLSEVNCAGFELFKSTDGINFSSMNTFLPAKGPSTYTYADANVQREVLYYYKVKQVDNNGAFKYSNIAEAILTNVSQFTAYVYPNPTQNQATLHIGATEDEVVGIKVYNSIGQIITSMEHPIKAGANEINVTDMMNKVSAGTYSLQVAGKTKQVVIRLVKID